MHVSFNVGDKAVYPARGVAEVVGMETKSIGEHTIDCYHLQVHGSGLKITVPVAKALENGMRPIADQGALDRLYEMLRDHDVPPDRQTWNRRHRAFMEKIRSGALQEVGEVYRELALLRRTKSLSHGERQMLNTARDLLVNELAVVRGTTEAEAESELEAFWA
jgi:CarD family transcriptional regulator